MSNFESSSTGHWLQGSVVSFRAAMPAGLTPEYPFSTPRVMEFPVPIWSWLASWLSHWSSSSMLQLPLNQPCGPMSVVTKEQVQSLCQMNSCTGCSLGAGGGGWGVSLLCLERIVRKSHGYFRVNFSHYISPALKSWASSSLLCYRWQLPCFCPCWCLHRLDQCRAYTLQPSCARRWYCCSHCI